MGNLSREQDNRVIEKDDSKPKANLFLKVRRFLSNRRVREFNTTVKLIRLLITTGSILYFLAKVLIPVFFILFS
jgi:hypothetical protein